MCRRRPSRRPHEAVLGSPNPDSQGTDLQGPAGLVGQTAASPLTDFPVVGYTLAAAFDVISALAGKNVGGGLVFEYGFTVETAGDSPVWHKSETDVFPGGAS